LFERPDSGERAVLVHCKYPQPNSSPDYSEFYDLAVSAGVEVLDQVFVRRTAPEPKYLIGVGKLEELAGLVEVQAADVVLFNHAVSPSQQRNLEKHLKVRVIDRSGLILDVFAQRARTHEGKLQVELAQLQYFSTRLIRGWTHLERQKGGIGMRGPGETQLELDRRLIKDRMRALKEKLNKVRKQRSQGRQARKKNNLSQVSIVGYTNAGKSSLFNTITGETVYAADQLFATLDPTIRRIDLPIIGGTILSDTVGFIRDLPHDLIEAFKATLEETLDADLLLHVIDISDESWREKQRQVEKVLSDIGALNVPILEVYNKIDMLDDVKSSVSKDCLGQITGVFASAKCSLGLGLITDAIAARLTQDLISGDIVLAADQGKIRANLYAIGAIDKEINDDDGRFILTVSIAGASWKRICRKYPGLESCLTHKSNLKFINEAR